MLLDLSMPGRFKLCTKSHRLLPISRQRERAQTNSADLHPQICLHIQELAIGGFEYCDTACKHACSLAQSRPSCQSLARGRSPALCDAVPQELIALLPGGTLATLKGPGRGKQGRRSTFTGTPMSSGFRVRLSVQLSVSCSSCKPEWVDPAGLTQARETCL